MLVNDIAFDLDGVLIDMMGTFNKILMERHGAKAIENGQFHIETAPPLTDPDIWECLNETYRQYRRIKIYDGAREMLTKLYERTGDPVTIITARPHRAASDTYALVNRLVKIPYRLVICAGSNQKLAYLNTFGHFIDDRRKTALELSEAGKIVFVPSRYYNQIPQDKGFGRIIFIDGIKDLIPQIEKLIKPAN